ncbi:MAG: hypothetical protein J5725_08240 [Bacteroidales bacterium]|nr:hypothetical protein [Bacteroidales bacterium]
MAQVIRERTYLESIIGRNDKISEKQEWEGSVRNIDGAENARKGDSFVIPENPIICETMLNGASYQYCIVELTKAGGEKASMRFFPNMLAKVALARDADGNALGRVKTSGTAATKFQEFRGQPHSIRKAMDFLAGKTIKVVDEQEVTILPFGKTQSDLKRGDAALTKTRIFVYDLVHQCL